MIHRSCASSIRTLINRHIRPTAAATTIQTETPVNIYNWHYLLPNSFVTQPVNTGYGFGLDVAGYSVVRGRGKFEAAKSNIETERINEDDDEDAEYSVSDDDNDDYDSHDDDDHMGTDDD
ncbi:hypothetical protein L1987_26636 [Smallanthus sonchifolius]|uniref:Uncharacterized protein n=1 Tax=Smallanthus sonchifolius TaxID=185202 RepID=A0ACB9IBF3_9ASTR|nr:hypothetical protein L1987_26636 [Smallanthus sonchifolius]